ACRRGWWPQSEDRCVVHPKDADGPGPRRIDVGCPEPLREPVEGDDAGVLGFVRIPDLEVDAIDTVVEAVGDDGVIQRRNGPVGHEQLDQTSTRELTR